MGKPVNSSCTHHMAKNDSLFSSLDTATEKMIYMVNDFTVNMTGHGYVTCRCSENIDVFDVPSLSANLLSISQLT